MYRQYSYRNTIYGKVNGKLIKKVTSDSNGFFQASLPVGAYSMFVKEEQGYYYTQVTYTEGAPPVEKIIGNKNQQTRGPRKTPITLKLKQKDWTLSSIIPIFARFAGKYFLFPIMSNKYRHLSNSL